MPVSTRRANADVHPGQVLLDSQQTRRTKKQIEADDTLARAAANASKEKATAKYRAMVERIAQLEDAAALVEKDKQTHANRPDLRREAPGSHDPLESREGDFCDDSDDSASEPEEGDPQSNGDSDAFIGTGDFAGDGDKGSGPAREDDSECDNDSDTEHLEFSDEDASVTAVRLYMPTKKVSCHTYITYCTSPSY
jgi:hypothetical protein